MAVSVDATSFVAGLVDPAREDVVFAGFASGITVPGRRGELELAMERMFEEYPTAPEPVDAGSGMSSDAAAPETAPGGGEDAGTVEAGAPDAGMP